MKKTSEKEMCLARMVFVNERRKRVSFEDINLYRIVSLFEYHAFHCVTISGKASVRTPWVILFFFFPL